MLYTFGDSYTWGANFSDDDKSISVWPYFLSKRLGCDFKNLATGGSSNWRTARVLNSLELTEDDCVVIAWSSPIRFEFGVNINHKPPPILEGRYGDTLQYDSSSLVVKRFYPQLIDRTSDDKAMPILSSVYGNTACFYNEDWFEEMFLIMFNSCRYKLESSKCKWLCFNTWCVQSNIDYINTKLNIPQYYMGSNNHLSDKNNIGVYWTKKEHEIIADNLFVKFEELYG